MNPLLEDLNNQIRENTSLLDENLRRSIDIKRKIVEQVSEEIHRDFRRRV